MMNHIVEILIVIIVILTQHYLSTRNNPYFGGILPLAYIIVISFFFTRLMSGNDKFSSWLAIIGGLAAFLSIWIKGRETVKKKRQKELERIELNNL